MARETARYNDLCSTIKQDISYLEKEIPRLQFLVTKVENCTGRTRMETAEEIRRLDENLQDLIRKSLLNVFQIQLLCGQNPDWKLQGRNLKRNLDRAVDRFCALNIDVKRSLEQYGTSSLVEHNEIQYRKKTGTFSSIQEEVDTATELMREGVDHVLTRNSVMYTGAMDMENNTDRFDTTNLQRCYRTLMAKKRSLMDTNDRDLSEKQRETKRKLIRDINELTRMYDDLTELVDEQVSQIEHIDTNVGKYDGYTSLRADKKKCIIM